MYSASCEQRIKPENKLYCLPGRPGIDSISDHEEITVGKNFASGENNEY